MEALWELLPAAIVSAVVSAIVALLNNRRTLQDSLDTKSGWRKEIFNVASNTYITTDHVYLLLAALRYEPHQVWGENTNSEPRDFSEMTSYIHYKLKAITKRYQCSSCKENNGSKKKGMKPHILDEIDSEIVRMIAKYLLKHHWENLGHGHLGRLKFRVMKEAEIIKEIYWKIEVEEKRR